MHTAEDVYIRKQNQAFHKMDKLFTKAVTKSQTLAENCRSFLHRLGTINHFFSSLDSRGFLGMLYLYHPLAQRIIKYCLKSNPLIFDATTHKNVDLYSLDFMHCSNGIVHDQALQCEQWEVAVLCWMCTVDNFIQMWRPVYESACMTEHSSLLLFQPHSGWLSLSGQAVLLDQSDSGI